MHGGLTAESASAISTPLRVAGINDSATYTVPIILSGVSAGQIARADISNLRDVLGRAVRADNLTYAWYTGQSPISWTLRGNEQTYTLDPNDFDNNNDKIRVRLTDRGGNVSAIESISDSINRGSGNDWVGH